MHNNTTSLDTSAIAGVTAGGVITLLALFMLIVTAIVRRKKKESDLSQQDTHTEPGTVVLQNRADLTRYTNVEHHVTPTTTDDCIYNSAPVKHIQVVPNEAYGVIAS